MLTAAPSDTKPTDAEVDAMIRADVIARLVELGAVAESTCDFIRTQAKFLGQRDGAVTGKDALLALFPGAGEAAQIVAAFTKARNLVIAFDPDKVVATIE